MVSVPKPYYFILGKISEIRTYVYNNGFCHKILSFSARRFPAVKLNVRVRLIHKVK
jgi:hypothetical protein